MIMEADEVSFSELVEGRSNFVRGFELSDIVLDGRPDVTLVRCVDSFKLLR